MDNFREEIVTRRTGRTLYNIMYIFAFVFMIFSGIVAFMYLMPIMNLQIDVPTIVIFVVAGLTTFLMWRNKDSLRTEYEYTLTNGEMDFAKVMGNTRRKHLLTVQLKTVEQGGPADSDGYRRLSGGPNVKTTDLTLNNDVPYYYLYFSREGTRNIILLEPSDAMIALMRLYNRNFTA